MAGFRLGPLLVAAFFCFAPGALAGQAVPSPAQAQEMLRNRPELIERLRQEIATSGLTPDQVRARLRAAGYPENLLDQYLTGGVVTDSSLSPDVFSAVRELGLVDSADASLLGDDVRRRAAAMDTSMRMRTTGQDTVFDMRSARPPQRPPERPIPDQRAVLDRQRARFDRDTAYAPLDTLRGAGEDSAALHAALVDSGFVIFGADVFRRRSTEFDPNLAGPVDASYRLGAGDRLVLILTGDVEASYTLDVTREGFVVIPQVGQIYVNNLTLGELENLLFTRLGSAYSGIGRGNGATTRFSVSVASLRSNQVYVTGDVASPGSYRVSSTGTALTAIYAAGGPTANGSLRQVQVRRGDRLVATLDVYDYLLRGDPGRDVRLQNGDVVFVPVHGPRVRVLGEVVRPATYELRPDETLRDLLRAAGGLMPSASHQRVQIERILSARDRSGPGSARVVMDVTAVPDGGADEAGPAVPLQGGDVVRVLPIAAHVSNRIAVVGNVWTPGTQGHTDGMTVGDALRAAGGVRPGTYLGRVLVTRLQPDSTRLQLRATLRDSTGSVINDFPLRENDEIRVFSVNEFQPTRFVAVTGAVRRGGQYPYREGMTLRDLVLLAGGLREGAYLKEAELARLPSDRTRGTTAQTFRTPLDSSYLFTRAPDGTYIGPPGLPAPAGDSPEITLEPYDNVLIMQQPDWELQRTVAITGEVRFPGRYAITNKNERLTDLIARAGGLTTEAYSAGVVFYRSRDRLGRIGIDLPAALKNRGNRDNLLLADGDSVNIPVYSGVVYVSGAVNSPVAVSYVPGRDIEYYIRASGGPSRDADIKRAYVTQPNGKVESRPSWIFAQWRAPEPLPGGRIFVPQRDPVERREFLATATSVAQILASLLTVIVVLSRN
ncbi:MAG: SLBB domain-containing protein [Gemmatimonadaceae bacterium]